MDYQKAAEQVLDYIGGNQNLVSVAHCATKLRLVVSKRTKCNRNLLENIEGVKGIFEGKGQLQIIFGAGMVNKVYEELMK